MPRESIHRRTVLRTCAAAAGVAASGLSGCLSSVPQAAGAGFDYENWLVAPGEFDAEHRRGFSLVRPSSLESDEDALGSELYDAFVSGETASELDLDTAEADVRLLYGPVTVWHGGVDQSAVEDALESESYEQEETRGDYDLWEGDDRTVAVGGSELVVGGDESAVETVIDAGTGEDDRYVEENEDVAAVTDRVGVGDVAAGVVRDSPPDETDPSAAQFAGHVATGVEYDVDGDTTDLMAVIVFESDADVDVDAVRTWLEETEPRGFLTGLEEPAVEADGRAAVVSGTLDTGDLAETGIGSRFGGSSGRPEPPQAGASVSVDPDADTITATWTSNQNAESLTVTFTSGSGPDDEATLTEVGDSYTYEGEDGTEVDVKVVATTDDGTSAVVLHRPVSL